MQEYYNTATIIGLIVSVFIPLCSSLLGKAHWPSEILGILTLVLSTADGFFTEWAKAGDGFDWRHALALTVGSFILAIVGRVGLWKNTKTDANVLAFGSKKPASTVQPSAQHAA